MDQSPLSLVQKGQSDPFNAYSIKIDARVNQIMTFYRDSVMPLLFEGPAFVEAKKVSWKDIVNGLEAPGSAYCYLARNSAAAAIVAPSTELAKQTYMYQARSTKALREYLNQESSIILSRRTVLWIFTLFDAEVMARNLPGAVAHGGMLVRYYKAQSERGPVDLTTLTSVLFSDLNLACLFLIRPLFDYQNWIPRVCGPVFDAVESKIPAPLLGISGGTSDLSVRNEKLAAILKQRRRTDTIRALMFKGTDQMPLPVLLWITIRSMLDLAALLHLYLDYVDFFEKSVDASQESKVQAYLALATIYLLRLQRYNKVLHGIRLYESGLQMSSQIQQLLTEEAACADYNAEEFANARLWALFIGAYGEQMPLRDRPEPNKAWFNINFVEQVRQMGLTSWEEIRAILEGFIFNDSMTPPGSQWPFNSLAAVLERPGQAILQR
ncbi:hypothetical protein H2200_011946 [Cladophialophora chaetospira]|uniref:Uncharacterized protein n=1 Tax=Cladophialophora chaetospira TaxID=386627 RepID=A0AA38WZ17_9EURO|nr:hypothetical protein H2200_011946 [Cladophialophora chaetospira]